jgi:hypothetical protein
LIFVDFALYIGFINFYGVFRGCQNIININSIKTLSELIQFNHIDDDIIPMERDIIFKKASFSRISRFGFHRNFFTGEELKNYWLNDNHQYAVGVTEHNLYFLKNNVDNDYIVLRKDSIIKSNILKVTFDEEYDSCTCFIDKDGEIRLYSYSFASNEHSCISATKVLKDYPNFVLLNDSDEDNDWSNDEW